MRTRFRASAPGRVNLIGEHIDYCGFSVLPCAIEKRVTVDVELVKGVSYKLRIEQEEQTEKYDAREFMIAERYGKTPHWTDYVLAAYRGVSQLRRYEEHDTKKQSELNQYSIKVSVKGDIPPAAGLSSSSALVVASGLAFLDCFNIQLTPLDLANYCADWERYSGTAGGGMDQAAILLSKPNHATLIDFEPNLKATPVQVCGQFVAAHCMVNSAKAVNAAQQFNQRVLECRIGSVLLGALTFQKVVMKDHGYHILSGLFSMTAAIRKVLNKVVQLPECLFISELTDAIVQQYCLDDRLKAAWRAAQGVNLKIRSRARHVLSEALRVQEFIESAADPHKMGRIMNESDLSCQFDYECSCPELAELTECMRKAGALGARLTGAGWGGFAIALLDADQDIESFMEEIKRCFYEGRGVSLNGPEQMHKLLFTFEPSEGARLECQISL